MLRRQVAANRRLIVVAAAVEQRDDALGLEELINLCAQGLHPGGAAPTTSAPTSTTSRRGNWRCLRFLHLVGRHAVHQQTVEHADRAGRLGEDDLACELAAIALEVRFGLDLRPDDFGGDGAIGTWRPGGGEADDRLHLWLDHVRAEALERPALPERERLTLCVRKPPLSELLQRPVTRLLNPGTAGEPRAVDVGQPADVIHHLRPVQPFVSDSADGLVIQFLDRLRQRKRGDGHEQQEQGNGTSHRCLHSPDPPKRVS